MVLRRKKVMVDARRGAKRIKSPIIKEFMMETADELRDIRRLMKLRKPFLR